MRSRATRKFWRQFENLSPDVQERARQAYKQWRDNPAHPSLHFKRVSNAEAIYSVRVGLHHRALGLLDQDGVTWFWIGSHDEYERMLGS
jgi:hypothetical protein